MIMIRTLSNLYTMNEMILENYCKLYNIQKEMMNNL